MASFFQYDPSRVIVSWRRQLQGFGPDTIVKVAWNEDLFTESYGTGGDVVRAPNSCRAGKVTVTLLQQSPSNSDLVNSAFIGDVAHMTIKNLDGAVLVDGSSAQIVKFPDLEFAATSGTVDWVFACATLERY